MENTSWFYQGKPCEIVKTMTHMGNIVVKIRRVAWHGGVVEDWHDIQFLEIGII